MNKPVLQTQMATSTPEDSPQSQRRHLALFFPFLPVDRLGRQENSAGQDDGAADTPLVLVEKVRGAMRIAATCPLAASLGLSPGMALADARAQVPLLKVVDHDPAADLAWLERLADLCDRFTPLVATEAPDALALDITGCAHLFGGEAPLLGAVARFMTRWSDDVRLACGDTPRRRRRSPGSCPQG